MAEAVCYPPIPLPVAGELVHVRDANCTVMFIWHPRRMEQGGCVPVADPRLISLVHAMIMDDDEVRVLNVRANAVKEPAWIATIIASMGFELMGSRFGVTDENDVPADQWEFLDEAVQGLYAED
jgi:hypothetical protein